MRLRLAAAAASLLARIEKPMMAEAFRQRHIQFRAAANTRTRNAQRLYRCARIGTAPRAASRPR
jgi:hypothetical protein